MDVALRAIPVRGRVGFNDRPLTEASVIFGGESGTLAVAMRSDEKGEFRGFVPSTPDEKWLVTVSSDMPLVKRNFHDVAVRPSVSGDDAVVDLRLDETVVRGDVVDEANKGVANALVNISPERASESVLQVSTETDGHFEAFGLAPGRYKIQALGFLKESEASKFSLSADEETAPLRLILKPNGKRGGVLVTRSGQPVAGAEIVAFPVDAPTTAAMPVTTREDGRFVLLLNPQAHVFDLAVSPPGFAYATARMTIPSGPLTLVADDRFGTLVLEFAREAAAKRFEPYLRHGGAMLAGYGLSWATFNDSDDKTTRVRLPRMETGAYEACLIRLEEVQAFRNNAVNVRCAAGYLSPYSELKLQLPSR